MLEQINILFDPFFSHAWGRNLKLDKLAAQFMFAEQWLEKYRLNLKGGV